MINDISSKITDIIDLNRSPQAVSYLNIYNYNILRKHFNVVGDIDFFTLDGIMLTIFFRIFYGKKIKRKSPDFSSYFQELFCFMEDNGKKMYFIGGSQNDIERFVQIIRHNYPRLLICGYKNGYQLEERPMISQLISEKIDTVIVGMGTPKQEYFMAELMQSGFEGSCFSCGAFFSQTASKGKDYYPAIVNKLNLRWLYRIYKEPKLLRRYAVDYPIGLKSLIIDKYNSSRVS